MFNISVLIENTSSGNKFLSEHGLSLFLDVDGYNIVFDFGQSDNYLKNAVLMNIDLIEADVAVISHGHYDHTSGVNTFLNINEKAFVFIGQGAYYPRYNVKDISNPQENNSYGEEIGIQEEIKKNLIGSKRGKVIKSPLMIKESIMLSGPIPCKNHETKTPFMININGEYKDDPVLDEQFMIIKREKGYYIFTGCCHAGITNTVEYARYLMPEENLLGLIGGLHLKDSDEKEWSGITDYLQKLDIDLIIPLHCTGDAATKYLKEAFGEKCKLLSSGDSIILD